jgi:hypothetical protein
LLAVAGSCSSCALVGRFLAKNLGRFSALIGSENRQKIKLKLIESKELFLFGKKLCHLKKDRLKDR